MKYSFNPLVLLLLYIPSKLYSIIVSIRNRLYDKGFFKAHWSRQALISVGNITTGGTGKTPFVSYLCGYFLGRGKRIAIVSRGYKGKKSSNAAFVVSDGKGEIFAGPDECGDEPFLLASSFPTIPVLVSRKRSNAVREADRLFKPDIIILDDGYQHRAVARDIDILLIDATEPFGNYRTLPSGILREPIKNVRRADMIIITRAEKDEDFITLKRIIGIHNRNAKIATAGHFFSELLRPGTSDAMRPSQLAGKKVFAFCAIGNPGVFILDIEKLGAEITGSRFFRDHHRYSREEIEAMRLDASVSGAEMLLTTFKDIINMPAMENMQFPLYYARIQTFVHDEERFFGELEVLLVKRTGSR